MEKISYEDASKELKDIVVKLEEGSLPMTKAVELFERGNELIKVCYACLDQAKGKFTEIKETLDSLEEV